MATLLGLSACASYDDYDDHSYDDSYYEHRDYRRSSRYNPYYDPYYNAYYDPFYDRYYSRYRGAYYDPFYGRYYYYGAGSYGRYGFYRRGHGYYCPVHSGYYGRNHYHSHNHNVHGESVRDRNQLIQPNRDAVMDAGNNGSSSSTTTSRRRIITPQSQIDNGQTGRRNLPPQILAAEREISREEYRDRISQIRERQTQQIQSGELPNRPQFQRRTRPSNEVFRAPTERNRARSQPTPSTRVDNGDRVKQHKRNRNMH